jgi:hypothetical protein
MSAHAEHTKTAAAAAIAAQPAPSAEFDRLLQQRTFSPQDLLQGDNLDRLERIAERMASGRMTVPEYLRGNIGDCMAIAMQAMLWNMDPFAVAQKTHIVNGRLGYEAQLVNAVLQNSGAVRGLPRYEYRGEGASLECRAGFVPRGETEMVWTEWLMSSQVTTKNSPLWKVNPRQQFGYLQVKNWARAFCPGAILGVYTVDELEDSTLPVRPAAAPATDTRPALPPYLQGDFDKNLPDWRKVIESGRKTAADLLSLLQTKATFTAAQQAEILKLGQVDETPPAGTADATAETQQ